MGIGSATPCCGCVRRIYIDGKPFGGGDVYLSAATYEGWGTEEITTAFAIGTGTSIRLGNVYLSAYDNGLNAESTFVSSSDNHIEAVIETTGGTWLGTGPWYWAVSFTPRLPFNDDHDWLEEDQPEDPPAYRPDYMFQKTEHNFNPWRVDFPTSIVPTWRCRSSVLFAKLSNCNYIIPGIRRGVLVGGIDDGVSYIEPYQLNFGFSVWVGWLEDDAELCVYVVTKPTDTNPSGIENVRRINGTIDFENPVGTYNNPYGTYVCKWNLETSDKINYRARYLITFQELTTPPSSPFEIYSAVTEYASLSEWMDLIKLDHGTFDHTKTNAAVYGVGQQSVGEEDPLLTALELDLYHSGVEYEVSKPDFTTEDVAETVYRDEFTFTSDSVEWIVDSDNEFHWSNTPGEAKAVKLTGVPGQSPLGIHDVGIEFSPPLIPFQVYRFEAVSHNPVQPFLIFMDDELVFGSPDYPLTDGQYFGDWRPTELENQFLLRSVNPIEGNDYITQVGFYFQSHKKERVKFRVIGFRYPLVLEDPTNERFLYGRLSNIKITILDVPVEFTTLQPYPVHIKPPHRPHNISYPGYGWDIKSTVIITPDLDNLPSGTDPVLWEIADGALPSGATLDDSTGVIDCSGVGADLDSGRVAFLITSDGGATYRTRFYNWFTYAE